MQFRLAASARGTLTGRFGLRGGLTMRLHGGKANVDQLELVFPFNPRMAATTLLPARWESDGSLRLPAVISAGFWADAAFQRRGRTSKAGCEGAGRTILLTSRSNCQRCAGQAIALTMEPLRLSCADWAEEEIALAGGPARLVQCDRTCRGMGRRPRQSFLSRPAGILANNVVSDP